MTDPPRPPPESSQQPSSAGSQTPAAAAPRKEPRIERIARRAHELYEQRGGMHGKDLQDWLQAEREIDAADDD
jgi:hypothetical protein